jgi:glycoprotein-N-acetylgalactosamine 3-beta-galactosyltransferase
MTGPKDETRNDDPNIPFVYLNINDKYELITNKAIETMKYIYDNHLNDFDWYLRANDDTYIIMENLKTFLAHKCPDSMKMYGKTLRYFMKDPFIKEFSGKNIDRGFIQGGAGWLISRESLKLFVETLNQDSNFCVMKRGQLEDQEICNCFRKINILTSDSRDEEYKERFLMDKFEVLFNYPSNDQLRYSLYPIRLVNIFLLY